MGELRYNGLLELAKRAVWDQDGKRFCYPDDLSPGEIVTLVAKAWEADEARQRAERASRALDQLRELPGAMRAMVANGLSATDPAALDDLVRVWAMAVDAALAADPQSAEVGGEEEDCG